VGPVAGGRVSKPAGGTSCRAARRPARGLASGAFRPDSDQWGASFERSTTPFRGAWTVDGPGNRHPDAVQSRLQSWSWGASQILAFLGLGHPGLQSCCLHHRCRLISPPCRSMSVLALARPRRIGNAVRPGGWSARVLGRRELERQICGRPGPADRSLVSRSLAERLQRREPGAENRALWAALCRSWPNALKTCRRSGNAPKHRNGVALHWRPRRDLGPSAALAAMPCL
jgi:hypothetical protein